jgi:hypothetical protein
MAPAGVFRAPDSLYTLGRTLLALWSEDDDCFGPPEALDTIPPLVKEIYVKCCNSMDFSTLSELYDAVYDRLLAKVNEERGQP